MTNQEKPDTRLPEGETELHELLQQAGPRPEPPAEDMAAIRAAARSAWEETVQTQPSSWVSAPIVRRLAMAAALILALGLGWWLQVDGPPEAIRVASFELTSGEVTIGTLAAAAGAELRTGTSIVTGTHASLAALRIVGGQSMRLDSGTTLRFLSNNRVELSSGAIYVDSPPSVPREASLIVETPLGSVTEIGTQYEVRLNGGEMLKVRVREGEVSVAREGGSHPAVSGEGLELHADGSVERTAIAPHDVLWQWVLETAPAIEIEGTKLGSFLDWVARETAWEIRFESSEVEAAALEIVLHGGIEGLRPDEAVAPVLRGSGLDYRQESGELLIFRP